MIITIDGKCGQGKSTVAKLVSERLGFQFISTGMFVRYATLHVKRSVTEGAEIEVALDQVQCLPYDLEAILAIDQTQLRDESLTPYLGTVANHGVALQRGYELLPNYCKRVDTVLDGRDLFAVFPNAELRYFFDAPLDQRARLRADMHVISLSDSKQYLENRDSEERAIPPIPPEVITVNPLAYTVEELVDTICLTALELTNTQDSAYDAR